MLADMAVNDAAAFAALVEVAKGALPDDVNAARSSTKDETAALTTRQHPGVPHDLEAAVPSDPSSIRSGRCRRLVARQACCWACRAVLLAERAWAVREAGGPGTVTELFVTREAAERHPELLGPAAEQGVPVQLVSGEVIGHRPDGDPSGGRRRVPDSDRPLDEVLAAGPRLVAVLAHARDPGNAGTRCCRRRGRRRRRC